jgi:hypothetical protein
MQNFVRSALIASLVAGAGACVAEDGDSSLTVINESSFFIDELYIAEVSDPNWGPDLVGDLAPGEEVTIILDCGTYDVLVVDETGVECELANVDLCFDDDAWVITDVTLDVCAFGP